MKISILCDDEIHKKIKIISVLKAETLNILTVDLYKKLIAEWEKSTEKSKSLNRSCLL